MPLPEQYRLRIFELAWKLLETLAKSGWETKFTGWVTKFLSQILRQKTTSNEVRNLKKRRHHTENLKFKLHGVNLADANSSKKGGETTNDKVSRGSPEIHAQTTEDARREERRGRKRTSKGAKPQGAETGDRRRRGKPHSQQPRPGQCSGQSHSRQEPPNNPATSPSTSAAGTVN